MHRPPLTPRRALCALTLAALIPAAARADSFGLGASAFDINFVDITGGAIADDTGYGAVLYDYRMSVYEITEAMVNSYNALGGSPVIDHAGLGDDRPATSISWTEAARFVNWLNTSTGHSPAYNFVGGGVRDGIQLWNSSDEGFSPANPFRNANAFYFLPSEDEWYRAAYFDPAAGVYWDYTTGSDTAPTAVTNGTAPGTAVFDDGTTRPSGPAPVNLAGGLSPFGTMAQGGNAEELLESAFVAPNDSPTEFRVERGGWWGDGVHELSAITRGDRNPGPDAQPNFGFRVASMSVQSVPDGGSPALMLGVALLGILGVKHRVAGRLKRETSYSRLARKARNGTSRTL